MANTRKRTTRKKVNRRRVRRTPDPLTKLEVFIWNGTGSAPASPSYTLSKLIPASNNVNTYYNISPYIREYISWIDFFPTFTVCFTSCDTILQHTFKTTCV